MATRVFIGNVSPVLRVGLEAELTDAGIDVVAAEDDPLRIPDTVARVVPDAAVLDRDDPIASTLCARVRAACPSATVVLWARDETVIEVFDPGADIPRLVLSSAPADLCRELAASRSAT